MTATLNDSCKYFLNLSKNRLVVKKILAYPLKNASFFLAFMVLGCGLWLLAIILGNYLKSFAFIEKNRIFASIGKK